MKFDPNPRKKGHYKRQCHLLLDEIFGTDKYGRKEAYTWLDNHFSQKLRRHVHFSDIEDEDILKEIFEKLWHYSFKVNNPIIDDTINIKQDRYTTNKKLSHLQEGLSD